MHSFVLHFNLCLPNVIPVSLHSTAVQLVIRLGTMGLLRNWFCIMTLWIIIVLVVAFSSLARILGECSIIHSPPALFFSFLFFFLSFFALDPQLLCYALVPRVLAAVDGEDESKRERQRQRHRERSEACSHTKTENRTYKNQLVPLLNNLQDPVSYFILVFAWQT